MYRSSSKFVYVLATITLSTLVSIKSQAQDQSVEAKSEIKHNALISDDFFQKKFRLSYAGEFEGTALGSLDDPYQPDENGQLGTTVRLHNSISIGYQVAPTVKAYLTPRFMIIPVQGEEQLVNKDWRIGISNSQLIHEGNLNLFANATLQFPLTEASREAHRLIGPGTFLSLSYDIPDSRFSLSADADLRAFIITSHEDAENNEKNPGAAIATGVTQAQGLEILLAFGPRLSYKLSSTVSLAAYYELAAARPAEQDFFDWNRDGTQARLYVSWDATPGINLSPYLKLFPGTKPFDTVRMAWGAEVTGTVF